MRFILLIIFLVFSLVEFSFAYGEVVERINPKGFRIKTSDYIIDGRISYAIFKVKINKTLEPEGPFDFIALITESDYGQWIYDNINVRVEGGWKISYHIDYFEDPYSFNTTHKPMKQVRKDTVFPNNTIDITSPSKEQCSKLYEISEDCELSVTTVRGQRVCKGVRIFEEDFNFLSAKVWKIDARIPLDTEDSPFVSFQNDPEVVYARNGVLRIKPKFLCTPGVNETLLKTGTLNIENCSGIGKECLKKAKFSQILPPIISARIRTKHSFSFRYGKIVIGAKMPRGDWTMPMLFLDPMENYYGSSNYASGQIRIASLRGNDHLQSPDNKDLSSRHLSGGVVLEDRGSLHEASFRHYDSDEQISHDFHNFSLTWTEDSIIFKIDDHEYGIIKGGFSKSYLYKNSNAWQSDSILAPFDREFYFTIGLSVGGHVEFPDFSYSGKLDKPYMKPWNNQDPKAMLKFWNDRGNWMRSWIEYNTQLEVNFILVDAL
ncbi:beta-1,3-glucan-binding protein 1-like [Episyrphus balteatus]|uniref:beta-1,3-glucan-binding protein 1-like n=1 Tax=Episyrphus balteatus TaxID=286459 RepID=UPI00248508B9|nr:beta-1,3-glucan-binding protein 1-like [Episyrphus balteatus]